MRNLAVWPFHRANFGVLDNPRVRISQNGVRRQARQGNGVIGCVQVAQWFRVVAAVVVVVEEPLLVVLLFGLIAMLAVCPGRMPKIPQAIGARLQHLDLHHHSGLALSIVVNDLLCGSSLSGVSRNMMAFCEFSAAGCASGSSVAQSGHNFSNVLRLKVFER